MAHAVVSVERNLYNVFAKDFMSKDFICIMQHYVVNMLQYLEKDNNIPGSLDLFANAGKAKYIM